MWRGGEEGGRVSREFSRNFCKGWRRIGVRLGGNVGLGRQINPCYRSTRRDPSAAFVSGRQVVARERENRNLASLDPTQLPANSANNLAKSLHPPRQPRGKIGRRRKGKFLSLNILRYEFFSFFFPPCKLSRERRIYPSGVIRGWYIFSSFSAILFLILVAKFFYFQFHNFPVRKVCGRDEFHCFENSPLGNE